MGIPFVAFTVLVLLTNSVVGAKPPLSGADLFRALLMGSYSRRLPVISRTPHPLKSRPQRQHLFAAFAALRRKRSSSAIVALV